MKTTESQYESKVRLLDASLHVMRVKGPKSLKGSPVTVHLYMENVDAAVAQAVSAGAKITMPLADMFRGDRYAQLEDPFG